MAGGTWNRELSSSSIRLASTPASCVCLAPGGYVGSRDARQKGRWPFHLCVQPVSALDDTLQIPNSLPQWALPVSTDCTHVLLCSLPTLRNAGLSHTPNPLVPQGLCTISFLDILRSALHSDLLSNGARSGAELSVAFAGLNCQATWPSGRHTGRPIPNHSPAPTACFLPAAPLVTRMRTSPW